MCYYFNAYHQSFYSCLSSLRHKEVIKVLLKDTLFQGAPGIKPVTFRVACLITITHQTCSAILGSVMRIPQNPLGTTEVHINFPERLFIRPAYLIQTHKYIWAFWPDHLTFDAIVMVCMTEPKHTAWEVPWACLCFLKQAHTHAHAQGYTNTHTSMLMHVHTHSIRMW